MKKILVCSDLHTNFHKDGGKSLIKSLHPDDVDIAVVAGDLGVIPYHIKDNFTMLCDKYPQVVYVAGNHEYYGQTFRSGDDFLSDMESKFSNLTWLNNTRVKIDGINFTGATMWFARTIAAQTNKHYLNDFTYIRNCDPIAFDKYEETVDFFNAEMQEGDVVVTHHLPTYKSIPQQFTTSEINCFFANRLDALMLNLKPVVWIHGHTHSNCDYTFGPVRVCCNPFGYPAENSVFKDDFIIEI